HLWLRLPGGDESLVRQRSRPDQELRRPLRCALLSGRDARHPKLARRRGDLLRMPLGGKWRDRVQERALRNPGMTPAAYQKGDPTDMIVESRVDANGIRTITLNRPPANAINHDMRHAIHEAFIEADRDWNTRVVVFDSSVDRFFSAGMDIKDR